MNAYLSAGCAISPLFANTVITTTEKWYVNVEYAACTVENKSINAASTIDIQISAEIYNYWLSFEAKLVSRQLLNKYEESFFLFFFLKMQLLLVSSGFSATCEHFFFQHLC